jgi:hypothetical protein
MPTEFDPNADEQQPATPATPAEPTPEAPAAADTESPIVDLIATAVGTGDAPAPDAKPEEVKPDAEPTPEDKAKADEAQWDAEAKRLGLKEETTAKFKELSRDAARAKELEPEVETLRAQVQQQQEVFDHLERNGVTGEQFGEAVMVLSFINSGDPVRMQRAYETLGKQMAQLGEALGLEAPGYDPLAAHPDLQEAVLDGMDRKHALEIARGRQFQATTTQHSSRQGQQQQATAEMQRATQELQALEQHLRRTDPQFDAKWSMLRPTLVPALARLPLGERAQAFHEAYAAFQLPAAPAAPAQTRPDPANPGRPAMGAGAKAPTNSAEAIMQGLQLG